MTEGNQPTEKNDRKSLGISSTFLTNYSWEVPSIRHLAASNTTSVGSSSSASFPTNKPSWYAKQIQETQALIVH